MQAKDSPFSNECETWYLAETQAAAARLLVDMGQKTLLERAGIATTAYRYASLFEGFELENLSSWGADTSNANVFDDDESKQLKNKVKPLSLAFMNKSFANDDTTPQFTTQGGDYEQGLKARLLDKVCASEYVHKHGMFDSIHDMHRHGAIIASSATGEYYVWAITYENSKEVQAELDDGLAVGTVRQQRYGAAHLMTRTVWMNPEVALARFGSKHRTSIYANIDLEQGVFKAGNNVGLDSAVTSSEYNSQRRVVRIIMGWAMGKDGREMFVLKDGTVLRDRVWEKPHPPCVHWTYCRQLGGEGGSCITSEVYEASRNQNRLYKDMDSTERNTPGVLWAVNENSTVATQIENTEGVMMVKVPGNPGDAMKGVTVTKFNPQSMELAGVYDDMIHANSRISANHTNGTKQQGTTSGIQEHYAASYYTEAFADCERRAIRCRAVDTAEIFVWCIAELSDSKHYATWVGDKRTRRQVKGADLDLDLDRYVLDIKPASEAKDSPQATLQKVEGWLKDPTVSFTGADMHRFMETYDIEDSASTAFGLEEWATRQVDKWLTAPMSEMSEQGFYQAPEASMQLEGLGKVLRVVNLAWLKAREDKIPEPRKKFFEQFLATAIDLIHKEQSRMAALQAPPG